MNLSIKLSKGKAAEWAGEFLGTFFLMFVLFISPLILQDQEPLLVGLFYIALIAVFGIFSKAHFNPIFSFGDFMVALYEAIKTKDYSKVKDEAIRFGEYFVVQLLASVIAFALVYRLRDQVMDFTLVKAGYSGDSSVKQQLVSAISYGTTFKEGFGKLAFVLELFFSMTLVLVSMISVKYNKSIRPYVLGLCLLTFMFFADNISGASFNPVRSISAALFLQGEYWSDLWLYIVAPLLGAALGSLVYYGITFLKGDKAVVATEAKKN